MELAKPSLDVGLYVRDVHASRTFYETEVGLQYEEMLAVGGGVRQHRIGLRGSVLKVNESRAELTDAPTGYAALLIADAAVTSRRARTDPDGLRVELVPPATDDVTAIGIVVATADPDSHERFLVDGLGASVLGHGRFRIGTTVVVLREDATTERAGPLTARGFRYLTIQVHDVVAAHRRLVALGYEEAMSPRKLGEVAAISFVRDPGGNWLEISQRASLTGPLPDAL